MDKTLLWGVAAGAGIAIVAGGIAVMVVGKKKRGGMSPSQLAAIARLSRAQRPLPRGPVVSPVVAVPVVGRPFSDPFHHEIGGASMWGSGPWAHRAPRLRPVPIHH